MSRERVLVAAVGLADEDGIDSLTMRRLGRSLGVEAMSLYNHVGGKEDLLDGLVDAVFTEIDVPDGPDWPSALRARCVSVREALLRHRWAIGLMDSRSSPGPATLEHHERVLAVLRGGGFTVELAASAFAALDAYVYGFVLQEVALPFEDADETAEVVAEIAARMPADRYPHLAEMAGHHADRPDYRFGDQFEFGLDLVLDGLERALAAD